MKMIRRRPLLGCGIAAAALGAALPSLGQKSAAIPVQVEKTAIGYRLLRDGKPYPIKGVGGDTSLHRLKAAGGNSFRTWGTDKLDPLLDEAQKQGLTVCVGIWLGHERHGFKYDDADQVAAQSEKVREAVLRYKDHPAVLMWGIGNEMEGAGKGDNAAIWSAVNNLAAMVKKLDPQHPTMTVVAEIGGDRVKNIHRLCPDIDIVGINSYAGGPSIPQRYVEAGGKKPYVLTEFGPPGNWEVAKTTWGAPLEPTSTQKAASYRRTHLEAIQGQPLSLGGYAFLWGSKQEATATWFGMLLPDGTRLGPVDAMTELWSGRPPANRCPAIAAAKLVGAEQVDPEATLRASLEATDPEGDPLRVEWVVQAEPDVVSVGGDNQVAPPKLPEAVVKADARSAEIRAPKDPGPYRIYAFVRDDKGNGAVASLPFLVKGTPKKPDGMLAKLPLVVYAEQDPAQNAYFPTGWMGNTKAIKVNDGWTVNPHGGKTSMRCSYETSGEWGGVVWQHPNNDWGERPGGWNLNGAKMLTFWARGDKGGEVVSFEYGLLGADKPFGDTGRGKLEKIQLSKDWTRYEMDLKGKNLSRIKTGFAWVVAGAGAPVTFYLDDIRFE
ncbi:MAG: glycoside hydrolase family 2 TIM barrel-domain containing protein [Actinomycetota bacterium]